MRIYFDENISPGLVSGFKAFQDGRKSEDIQVCSVVDEFGRGEVDEVWIPKVAQQHGVIVTQDLNIHRARAQWELCNTNRVGVFFLKPSKLGWGYWESIRLTLKWWEEIKDLARNGKRP